MTTMQIIVTVKSVYGNDLIYPVCPSAQKFAQIAGTKTLSLQNLRQIEALGFSVAQSTLPMVRPAYA